MNAEQIKERFIASGAQLGDPVAEAVVDLCGLVGYLWSRLTALEAAKAPPELASLRAGGAGLSYREQRALYYAKSEGDRNATLLPDEYRPLLRIIDRLLAAKTLPWIRVVDGKRPEGLADDERVVVIWGHNQAALWLGTTETIHWDSVEWCVRYSDILATLPKEVK
jgi:hypothetical protein